LQDLGGKWETRITRSRDLIHWEIIGHAFTRNDMLDLTDIDDSCGLWAPDISYYQGKFLSW
jgi:xylan 1,4-beta-xylosidase